MKKVNIVHSLADDGHKIMVDAIPRWMSKKTLTEYTTISLLSRNDYSRLNGMESDKLQILLLRGMMIPDISNSFFAGMKNLDVLHLSDLNLQPRLPESIGKLEKLRTLYLEGCKLGDIRVIGELVNLSVLCLCHSYMEEFPDEIGELRNLRLLDLTGCICKFRPLLANILGRLSELEGLYMFDSFENHLGSIEDGGTSCVPHAIEFNKLQYLNALQMHIWCAEQLSIDSKFVKNLDKFRICVKYGELKYSDTPELQSFHGILHIKEIDIDEVLGIKTLQALLKKADWLRLSKARKINNIVMELDNEGLRDLKYLEVDDCKDMDFIVNLKGKNDLLVFPSLLSLKLKELPKLKWVCDEEAPSGIFSNLQDLSIYHLKNLQYVLPFAHVPRKLVKIEVSLCHSVNFIFMENVTDDGSPAVKEETEVIELPFLKSLELSYMDHLISLLGSENLFRIGDGVQGHQVFFSPRVLFSSLEQLSLVNCKRIVKLWDKALGISSFQSLKTIKIDRCEKLSSVGPLSIFSTLVQLESLTIENCKSMHEVITADGTEETEIHDQVVIFPHLKDLVIRESSLLKSFYGGIYKLKFPKLKNLQLDNLVCLNNFAGSQNSSVLFHEEMDFPCLEELAVSCVKDEVMGLWDWHLDGQSTPLFNPIPMLRKLTLGKTNGLRLIPSIIYKNLSSLNLTRFNDEVLLSSGKEGSVWTYSQLPKMKDLCVADSNSLKDLLGKEDFNAVTALTFCGQLKNLALCNLPRLKIFPWHLFKNLCSLQLVGLSWEYVLSADTLVRLQKSLQQLEALMIRNCKKMRVVIQDDGEGDADLIFEFPRLKAIILSHSSITGFSSTINATLCLPSLEGIKIEECEVLQHFWSGPIIAPKLKEIDLRYCNTMQLFLAGNPNQLVELESLKNVQLSYCSAMLSFSSVTLRAPSLWQVRLEDCPQMQWFLPNNPNHDDALVLLSLALVFITGCPQMQSFSTGSLLTPNIYYVSVDEESYLMMELEINLNHLLRSCLDNDFSEELNAFFCEAL
ncbi:hypothetical protein RND81_04G144500 [Saponaria officinalis]|uniref:Disease resistance protein At4g27190-like leucine-rich repeats domain-containing protein n=1 Tax=Saponaria officinalis TaxID=3572 RepID=A0AAW1LPP2_SAPOF